VRTGWAIICDFDGTAVTEDIGDEVSIHFAGADVFQGAIDGYRAGAYPFSALIERMFAPVTASRGEIAEFARGRAVLRPGLERFIAACRDSGVPFVVCSAGLDVYIEPVLERLPVDLRRHVELRSNRAHCSAQGLRVSFHGPPGAGCGHCGFCKGTVVEELRSAGHKVVLVGDGTADRCAAELADHVFARDGLVRWCEARGIPHRTFETFDDVMADFPG